MGDIYEEFYKLYNIEKLYKFLFVGIGYRWFKDKEEGYKQGGVLPTEEYPPISLTQLIELYSRYHTIMLMNVEDLESDILYYFLNAEEYIEEPYLTELKEKTKQLVESIGK